MIRERLIPAVGYVRMSTDRQEDSPARQKAEIWELAKRGNYKISEWYEDHGLTGTESAIPGISKLLAEWRDEASELEKAIRSKRGAPKADPEAAKVIARLRRYRGRLKDAERVTLAQALRRTARRVTIGKKTVGTEKFHYKEVFGSIEFHEGLGCDEPVPNTSLSDRPSPPLGGRGRLRQEGRSGARLP